jgi:hypothetical protein
MTYKPKFNKWDTMPHNGHGNFLGKATRQASQIEDNDDNYRERTNGRKAPNIAILMHKAGLLGLYIKQAHGRHREHARQYRICEDYPEVSKKILGIWRITKEAQKVRHHKEPWLTPATTYETLQDLDRQWNPPTPHIYDDNSLNQTRI